MFFVRRCRTLETEASFPECLTEVLSRSRTPLAPATQTPGMGSSYTYRTLVQFTYRGQLAHLATSARTIGSDSHIELYTNPPTLPAVLRGWVRE